MVNNDTVTVKLDKARTLKFRRKELKLLEKTFGKKLSKIDFEDLGVEELTQMIHLGLTHEDPDLTLEQTEELVDIYPHFGILVQETMEAFGIAMAGPRKQENGDKQVAKN